MIFPCRRAIMCGKTLLQHKNVPTRYVSIVSAQGAMSLSCSFPMGPCIPALFTRTSMRPHSVRAQSITRATSPGRRTSATRAIPRRPHWRTAAAVASTSARVRENVSTSAPSCASPSAIVRPIPRPPPVTTTVLPSSFITECNPRRLLGGRPVELGRILKRRLLLGGFPALAHEVLPDLQVLHRVHNCRGVRQPETFPTIEKSKSKNVHVEKTQEGVERNQPNQINLVFHAILVNQAQGKKRLRAGPEIAQAIAHHGEREEPEELQPATLGFLQFEHRREQALAQVVVRVAQALVDEIVAHHAGRASHDN